jgi:hypothetical protein
VAFEPKRLVSSFKLLQNGSQPVAFAASTASTLKDLTAEVPFGDHESVNAPRPSWMEPGPSWERNAQRRQRFAKVSAVVLLIFFFAVHIFDPDWPRHIVAGPFAILAFFCALAWAIDWFRKDGNGKRG